MIRHSSEAASTARAPASRACRRSSDDTRASVRRACAHAHCTSAQQDAHRVADEIARREHSTTKHELTQKCARALTGWRASTRHRMA